MKRAIATTCLVLAAAGCGGAQPAWEPLPLGTKADFRDIFFADAMHGWIAGGAFEIAGGLVGRTSDGGRTWHYASGLTQRDRMSVDAIHFFDTERGIVATSSGSVLTTSDGGDTWTSANRQGHVVGLTSLFFLDERHAWAGGMGDVIRTEDAGQTWTRAATESIDTSYRSPIRAIRFLDAQNGWVAGMHTYLARTTDGGASWEDVTTPVSGPEHPSFWDLTFVDSQTGWIVGEEGTMLSTTDGGTTWTRQSTGVKDAHSAPKIERIHQATGYVEVDAGDRTPGLTLSAVRFIDRRHGWVTGFYPNYGRSLILGTDDGGATWRVEADIAGEELSTLFLQGREALWAIGSRTREGAQAIYRRTVDVK